MIVWDDDRGALRFSGLVERGVRHAVTTRIGGVSRPPYDTANLGFGVPDDSDAVRQNRARAAGRIGADLGSLTVGGQVHRTTVARVTGTEIGRGGATVDTVLPATDAMITTDPNAALMILIADCSALLLYDERAGVLGAAHLGWRGTAARLGEKLADTMIREFGAAAEGLTGAISPGIAKCCYQVGDDVANAVRGAFRDPDALLAPDDDKYRFDIPAAILQQLGDRGVQPDQIELAGLCTSCHTDLFYSHRAEHGKTGRFGLLAALPR